MDFLCVSLGVSPLQQPQPTIIEIYEDKENLSFGGTHRMVYCDGDLICYPLSYHSNDHEDKDMVRIPAKAYKRTWPSKLSLWV